MTERARKVQRREMVTPTGLPPTVVESSPSIPPSTVNGALANASPVGFKAIVPFLRSFDLKLAELGVGDIGLISTS